MPITYKYHPDSNIIRTKASGVIETKDLGEYVNSILDDGDIRSGFIEIADFESVTDLVITYSDLSPFPHVWKRYMEKGCKAVLIYAPTNISYGMFRMLQTVLTLQHETADDLFMIFRSRKEVEKKVKELQ
jgi:hypothetical protein